MIMFIIVVNIIGIYSGESKMGGGGAGKQRGGGLFVVVREKL